MPSKVYVIGVGMTKFEKPGSRENFDYPDMARESGQKALQDAGIPFSKIEQAFVGYVYGESTSGQRAVYELGISGIPIVNVNNNCATGSTALLLAKNMIEGGVANCVLALGFEKMQRGSLSSQYSDRCNPIEKHVELMSNIHELTASPMTAQMFGNAGRDYIKKYNLDSNDDVFARIAHKNHKHSVNNPYAQFQKEYTLDEIKNSTMIHEPLTKLQCSPTSDGSAAAVLASEEFVRKNGLESKAVEIVSLEMATDLPSSFTNPDCMKIVGFDMSQLAARKAFQKAGITPKDVQVVELHDCFSCNELITYEALGLCDPGKAVDLVKQNQNTYGGKYVINPSGGLISKGHPLGATGIAQCAELSWQLRGQAGKRQVPNVKYGLQHNIGLGGAAVVGIYKLGFSQSLPAPSNPISPNSLKSAAFFEQIEAKLNENGKAMVAKIGSIIGFNVACSDKTVAYVIDLKNGNGSVKINDGSIKPDCTISIADDDLAKILEGKLNMMSAFTQKKLKISGNMSVAMKLNQVFASVAQKVESKPAAKPAAQSVSEQPSSELSKTTTKHKSGQFFDEVEAKMKQEGPGYVSKVNAVIGFTITDCPNNETISYILNLKKAPGSINVNDGSTKADVTITLKDSDMLDILGGKLNMMSAFTKKKLKISGNMAVAMKLNQIFSAVLKTRSKL